MRISITHGTLGSPTGNWFPWLSSEMKALGHHVVCPQYPTPINQSRDMWKSTFDEKFGFPNLNGDAVLIGHSVGVPFVLELLKESDVPVKACFLVAGFTRKLGIPQFDDLNESFLAPSFDWDYIRSRAGKTYVYHSNNDPYVPLELGSEIAENLNTELKLIPGGGHLNAESGYFKFPQLLEDIKLLEKAR